MTAAAFISLLLARKVRKEFIFRSQICLWFCLSPYLNLVIINVVFILLNFNLVGFSQEQIFTQSGAKKDILHIHSQNKCFVFWWSLWYQAKWCNYCNYIKLQLMYKSITLNILQHIWFMGSSSKVPCLSVA